MSSNTSCFISILPPRLSKLVLANLASLHSLISLLSGRPAKSGPLDFKSKIVFLHFFLSEKGLKHVYQKAIHYF